MHATCHMHNTLPSSLPMLPWSRSLQSQSLLRKASSRAAPHSSGSLLRATGQRSLQTRNTRVFGTPDRVPCSGRLTSWTPSSPSSSTSSSRIAKYAACTSSNHSHGRTWFSSIAGTTTTATSDPDAAVDKKLKSMVGLPCPGCGSKFQIDRPQEAGYLTRADGILQGQNETRHNSQPSDSASNDSSSSSSSKLAFDPSATTMTNAQYEQHLLNLDPKLLEEMMASALQDSDDPTTTTTTLSDDVSFDKTLQETDQEPVLSRKPTLAPSKSRTFPHPSPPRLVCHRCHSLSHHASPLANSSILPMIHFPSPPAPIPKHLETLRQSKTATVVLVVDLIDFPLSLPQPIMKELLQSKSHHGRSSSGTYPITPIILVGNKFDVMPLGTRKHKVIQSLQSFLKKHELDESVRAIHLVSAKNPVGDEIKMLLKSIGTSWSKSGKGNVVMVGGENVGKSQLLNAFLKECGRWKVNDQQWAAAKRAEGGEQQMKERQQKLGRLLGSRDQDQDEDQDVWAEMTGVKTYGQDLEQYEQLYKGRGLEKLNLYQTTVSNVPGTTLERIKVPLSVLSKAIGANYKEVQTKWLMDTPGIRTEDGSGHLAGLLTLEELKVTLPKKVLKPASFLLEEGKSFFLGGLVRIDCISINNNDTTTNSTTTLSRPSSRGSNPSPKITCFTTLPLHKTSTLNADKFLERSKQGQLTVLQPPFGSPERLAAFPGLEPISKEDIVICNVPPALDGLDLDSMRKPTSSSSSSSASLSSDDPFSKLDNSSVSHPLLSPPLLSQMSRQAREQATAQLYGQAGICDLVFAGIGWIMISGKFHSSASVTLRVWTPKGKGAYLRSPSLLPELAAAPIDKTKGGIRQKKKLFQPLPTATTATTTTIHTTQGDHHHTTD